MPTTPTKNLLYRAALPLLAPTPKGQMHHLQQGQAIDLPAYERLLCKHHVLGASLLLRDGTRTAAVFTSTQRPLHTASADTMFRVASITKMATALVTLMLAEDGAFRLDDPIAPLLPDGAAEPALQGITIRQLLCHTSGLRDVPAYTHALNKGQAFQQVLRTSGVRGGNDMVYCNFGFGLLGCMMEYVTGQSIEAIFQKRLFHPLGMRATLDASTLDEGSIMPMSRVLPYHAGHDVTITALGRHSLNTADPAHHFGHTAGAMYTDSVSLARMLDLIAQGSPLLSRDSIVQMTTQHSYSGAASTPTRRYGLGLVILDRPDLSPRRILGHQGFAYGCVDGAFFEEGTQRQVIFLNGGCSEAREGRMGLCNKELLQWALQKEIPSWT